MIEANNRITIDPEVCGGRPCIRGMRIRVKDILDMLAGGSTREEILADYPYLEDGDITAALEFASKVTDHPVIAAGQFNSRSSDPATTSVILPLVGRTQGPTISSQKSWHPGSQGHALE